MSPETRALGFLAIMLLIELAGCDFEADKVTLHVEQPSDWFKDIDGGADDSGAADGGER